MSYVPLIDELKKYRDSRVRYVKFTWNPFKLVWECLKWIFKKNSPPHADFAKKLINELGNKKYTLEAKDDIAKEALKHPLFVKNQILHKLLKLATVPASGAQHSPSFPPS